MNKLVAFKRRRYYQFVLIIGFITADAVVHCNRTDKQIQRKQWTNNKNTKNFVAVLFWFQILWFDLNVSRRNVLSNRNWTRTDSALEWPQCIVDWWTSNIIDDAHTGKNCSLRKCSSIWWVIRSILSIRTQFYLLYFFCEVVAAAHNTSIGRRCEPATYCMAAVTE